MKDCKCEVKHPTPRAAMERAAAIEARRDQLRAAMADIENECDALDKEFDAIDDQLCDLYDVMPNDRDVRVVIDDWLVAMDALSGGYVDTTVKAVSQRRGWEPTHTIDDPMFASWPDAASDVAEHASNYEVG